MAHYWLPDATSGTGTGTLSATGATGHWADDAGGTNLGKAASGTGDDVFFGAAAFNGASQVVTVNAAASCKDMDWTGATNTPTLALSSGDLNFYGNITFIAAMLSTGAAGTYFQSLTVGAATFTTNGLPLAMNCIMNMNGGSMSLQDNLVTTRIFYHQRGTLTTNGKNITSSGFELTTTGTKILTLSSSVITCSSWNYAGSNLTLTANTSTINCSGNFTGGGLITYNTVNLAGATPTITGNNTFKEIGLMRSGVQTITATGATQTVRNMRRDNGIAVKTFVNGTYVNVGGARIVMPYCSVSGATFVGSWYFPKSTDGGGNTGAIFSYPPNGGGWWALRHR